MCQESSVRVRLQSSFEKIISTCERRERERLCDPVVQAGLDVDEGGQAHF